MRALRPLLTTALLAGALTALGPAAYAGGGTSTYSCAFPAPLGSLPVPVTMTAPSPDFGALPSQMPVPAGTSAVGMTFALPGLLEAALGSLTGFSTKSVGLGMGDVGSLPLADSPIAGYSSLAHTMSALAGNGPFTVPDQPGSYPITMPSSFHLVGSLSALPFDITCATDAAAQIGTIVVGKSSSSTDAKLVKKRIPKNRAAKVRVTVARQFGAPADGRVKIKKGTHRIAAGTLSGGSVTIKTPTFKKPGRYVLRVRYVGDQISGGSSDKVVVRVLKRRS